MISLKYSSIAIILYSLAHLILLSPSHCEAETSSGTTTIKIGWIGPLTGDSAIVGVDSMKSIMMATEELSSPGGVSFQFLAEDDGYQTKRTITAYQKLVQQDGVRVIFIQTYGTIFALADRAKRDGVVIIDPLDRTDEIAALPDSIYCVATQSESISRAIASDIIQRNFERIAIFIEENDPWMPYISKIARQNLEAAGKSVVEVRILATVTDFNSVLTKHRNVEALILFGYDNFGPALAQARRLHIKAQFYGIGSTQSPSFRKAAGDAIEGARVTGWDAGKSTEYESFKSRFEKRHGGGILLPLAAVPSYDGANIALQCLKRGGLENLKSCLVGTQDYTGLSGKISFDFDGAVRTIHERLFEIRGSELLRVDTQAQTSK